MKDVLDAYFETRDTLYKAFGYDEGFPELIDRYTHVEWYHNGEGVNWIDEDEYSVEYANIIGEADGFVLFNVQDNGREFHMIFHRDNEVTDEDELEEKFDY